MMPPACRRSRCRTTVQVGGAPLLALALLTAPLPARAQGTQAAPDTVVSGELTGTSPDSTGTPGAPETRPAARNPMPPRPWRNALFRPDRLEHMSLAFGLGVGVGMLSRAPAAGAGVAVGLGFAKELADDHFDRGDFAADVIGAGLAALVVAALTR